ncbi:hypothetical protein IV203_019392 [Nitzschia inconspicua]|uniref:Uncharacterized protein n=1 Tax=Nitzschia inconspicua TaxID=303405 RepID=A0A9K3LZ31_9STRA|nr:hypothetical protein IV203_019392 [Nitzschia inconspicua]
MAFSTCSHSQSSSASGHGFSIGESATQQLVSSIGTTVVAAGVAAAPAKEEETLYEALVRFHQHEQTLDDSVWGDDSDEMYQRARRQLQQQQRQEQFTSGLKAPTEDWYLRQQQQLLPEQQQEQQPWAEDNRKLPAREPSQEDAKPPARGNRSEDGRGATSTHQHSNSAFSGRGEKNEKFVTRKSVPGIFHVNEPAIRSDAAMYIDAYGDVQNSHRSTTIYNNLTDGATSASSVASVAYKEHNTHHPPPSVKQSQSENRQFATHQLATGQNLTSQNHSTIKATAARIPQSISAPMEPEDLRQAVAIPHQSQYETHPIPSFHDQFHQRNRPSTHSTMDSDELVQTHGVLQAKKYSPETPISISAGRNAQRSTARSVGSLYPIELLDRRKNDDAIPPSSTCAMKSSPERITPHLPRNDVSRQFGNNVETSQRHRPQQQQQLLHDPSNPQNIPAPRRRSETIPRQLNPMDFGSDEHIRNFREMERYKNGDLHVMERSRRDAEMRRSSTTCSIKSTSSNPCSPSMWGYIEPSPTRSGGHNVHRFGRSQSDIMKHPLAAEVVASRATVDTNLHRPRSPPSQFNSRHLCIETKKKHNPTRQLHNGREQFIYPTSYCHLSPQTLTNPIDLVHSHRSDQMPPRIHDKDRFGPHHNNDKSFHPSRLTRSFDSGDIHQSDPLRRAPFALNDEDEELKLALQLSLQETNARQSASSIPPPRNGQQSHASTLERSSAPRSGRVSNPYLQQVTESKSGVTAPIERSNFGQEGCNANVESEIDELMLALKISAEESRSPVRASSISGSSRPFVGNPSDTGSNDAVKPSEQYRILQQIREEKERKDLELALKASQTEAERRRTFTLMSDHQSRDFIHDSSPSTALDNHDTTRDFLVSQQKALEEYQRKRQSKNEAASSDHSQREMQRTQLSDVDRENLLVKGAIETQQAIATGRAHTVRCITCEARLQAPVSYALVYCPRCETISPA